MRDYSDYLQEYQSDLKYMNDWVTFPRDEYIVTQNESYFRRYPEYIDKQPGGLDMLIAPMDYEGKY